MKRIYQGRVSKAEILDSKSEPLVTPPREWNWETALWEHHALFQDAVNYYLVCLLALANGGSEETRRIVELRERMTTKRPDDPEDGQFYVWEAFRRKGATRRGLRDSVAPYLCPGKPGATAKECFEAVLAGNPQGDTDEGRALLDRGLRQLLSKCTGDSGCRNAAPEFLPRFCKPVGNFTFEEDASRLARDAQRPRLIQTLHDPATRFDSSALDSFGPQSVALVREGREIKGAKLQAKLTEFLRDWRERHPEPTEDWQRLEKRILGLADDVAIPDYAGTSAKGDDRFLLAAICFFRYLEKSEFIWREPTAEQLREWRKAAKLPEDAEFAKDPLQALTDERELLQEIERLKQPIRLTPADPEHSRRQFYFSDAEKFTERGQYRHEPNQRTVIVPLALQENGTWKKGRVRLHYSAPRLLREHLRADAHENLAAMPWLQPMMAALNLPEPMPQDFRDCPAALMPDVAASGERRILLNFPLTLDPELLNRHLGNASRWDWHQFGGTKEESYWLRWPSTWSSKAKSKPWWERGELFSCLAVDLGQREAGAFALLEVTPDDAPKPQSRKLGEAGGKTWWATVRATGMLRLPGEDAMVFRNGSPEPEEELSGERGRVALLAEWDEAHDICQKLGLDSARILGDDRRRYSFPELNEQLLFALRRAQTRLARLQSWSCIAHKDIEKKRRDRIAEEIRETEGDPLGLKPLVEKEAWELIAERLKQELAKERTVIPQQLVRIADRIQPLRGRRWEWALRDDGTRCHVLRRTAPGSDPRPKLLAGQRGLSMKRLEQLDSLRQRCQSLNRALLQTPGEPAKLGRSKSGIELPDPCPELLDRLDNLKEQRVNQTTHLILAQALGVRLRPHQHDEQTRKRRDIHGEYERIPGRKAVDFIVIENLKYYEMTQGRSRKENARLMKWCRRHLRDKLIELCEPYGIRVVEEWPADTSKFCSLTGIAGFRAVELTPDNRNDLRWRKHLERLADPERVKKLNKEERAESEQVKALFDALDGLNADLVKDRPVRPKWRTLLAPVAGGPIFTPMKGSCQQADINAAINLGLRAIAAPENHAIHLRIRGVRKDEKFLVRAENLREKARWGKTPPEIVVPNEKQRADLMTEAHPLFFADTGDIAEFDRAEIDGKKGFASSRGIRGTVNQKDWLRVGRLNNDRLEKAGLGRPLIEEDDVPM